jgi:hypothetical protein
MRNVPLKAAETSWAAETGCESITSLMLTVSGGVGQCVGLKVRV